MPKFIDTLGREWPLDLNIGTAKRLKERVAFDLVGLTKTTLEELANPLRLCDVLFVIVEPIAKERGVTDEAFAEGLGGDVLDAASDALLEAIVSFIPRGRRDVLTAAIQKGKEAETLAIAAATKALGNLDPASLLGSLSIGSPGSPG